jgi:hypothetical protein
MQRFFWTAPLLCAATSAFAHPSVMPHAHPHGVLTNLDALAVGVLLAALAALVIGSFRRG